ncbi:hypothetical protein TPSD3_09545 [Thioflexithrix psekupsensis]|uniref:DUF3696 domain-containing protein n=2 Tax=Thioflexithrix psekupsensis TaxID=1570016 RepID=A0A251XAD0_9GAMM|nr:hypothetical protein TPSD3_09545 [Thioflexithrix psekupsensis]
MITSITLKNFKCFKEEISFPLAQFNLFAGFNGSGKSTLLQSLLMMHQSLGYVDKKRLILNGKYIKLGSFDDVRNHHNSAELPIVFEFYSRNDDMDISRVFTLKKDDSDDLCLKISYPNDNLESLDFLLFARIHFISADRIGPQEFYKKQMLGDFPHVGMKGELTVNILDKLREKKVKKFLCLGENSDTLLVQTQEWLSRILSPIKLDLPRSKSNILTLSLGNTRPHNVGFAYSSILPLIVTGLIAEKGDILIIENPEIHLHPKAQSELVKFLTEVAKTGVQIFIESHSDHILNGLRIAVLEKRLTTKQLSILYFREGYNQSVVKIPIQKNGGVEIWPQGFFDQMDSDFGVLFDA